MSAYSLIEIEKVDSGWMSPVDLDWNREIVFIIRHESVDQYGNIRISEVAKFSQHEFEKAKACLRSCRLTEGIVIE